MNRWFAISNSFLQTNLIGRKTQPCQKDAKVCIEEKQRAELISFRLMAE